MIKHFDTDKKLRTKVIRKHRSNHPKSYKVRVYGEFYDVLYKDIGAMEVYKKSKNEIMAYMNIYMYYYENEEIMRLLEEKSNKKIEITDEW